MDFDPTEDQRALLTAVERLVERHGGAPAGADSYILSGAALERDLEDGGYYDVARGQDADGAVGAALLIEAVARSPRAAEVGASALVAPMLALSLPRPIVLAAAPLDGAVRFLDSTGTALIDNGTDVRVVDLAACRTEAVDTPFAYPFGRLVDVDLNGAPVLADVAPELMRQWWRVALAVEIGAVAQVALDMTVDYVKARRQFNRPIGSFQAIQHRLSECATMIHGTRVLARRAAWTGDTADAAFAAAHAKETAAKVHYDTHQFHGAMGVTLEHPLHFWSYRLKCLQGEMGGHMAHAKEAADAFWA